MDPITWDVAESLAGTPDLHRFPASQVLLWRIGIRIGDGREGARLEERGRVVSRGGGIAV